MKYDIIAAEKHRHWAGRQSSPTSLTKQQLKNDIFYGRNNS